MYPPCMRKEPEMKLRLDANNIFREKKKKFSVMMYAPHLIGSSQRPFHYVFFLVDKRKENKEDAVWRIQSPGINSDEFGIMFCLCRTCLLYSEWKAWINERKYIYTANFRSEGSLSYSLNLIFTQDPFWRHRWIEGSVTGGSVLC